ncbi:hypothetical protein V8C44DRAFT_333487 [Trichoderma aethiopicum]
MWNAFFFGFVLCALFEGWFCGHRIKWLLMSAWSVFAKGYLGRFNVPRCHLDRALEVIVKLQSIDAVFVRKMICRDG